MRNFFFQFHKFQHITAVKSHHLSNDFRRMRVIFISSVAQFDLYNSTTNTDLLNTVLFWYLYITIFIKYTLEVTLHSPNVFTLFIRHGQREFSYEKQGENYYVCVYFLTCLLLSRKQTAAHPSKRCLNISLSLRRQEQARIIFLDFL